MLYLFLLKAARGRFHQLKYMRPINCRFILLFQFLTFNKKLVSWIRFLLKKTILLLSFRVKMIGFFPSQFRVTCSN